MLLRIYQYFFIDGYNCLYFNIVPETKWAQFQNILTVFPMPGDLF